MNNLDKQYTDLLQDILDNGVIKDDRTGTGTKSVFGRQIRHDMKEGFPLLTTKKMPFKSIVTELLWFLKGDTNIKYLVDNGCNIWNGDTYKNYLKNAENHEIRWLFSKAGHEPITDHNDHTQYYRPYSLAEFITKIKEDSEFAEKWGELGPIYGKQWRNWRGQEGMVGEKDENGTRVVTWNQIDQIKILIDELMTNPDSRRLLVNAWNVGELDNMVLPPCHYGFQLYTRYLTHDELLEISPELKVTNAKKNAAVKIQSYENATRYRSEEQDIISKLPKRAVSLMWSQRSVNEKSAA